MKPSNTLLILTLIAFPALACFAADPPAASPAPPPAIDPKADAVLKQMSQHLAAAKRFTFSSHNMIDRTLESGQKVQVARNQKVAVRRPDGIAAVVAGDLDDLQIWYDGKRVTMLNVRDNTYGVADVPPTLDATFDTLAQKYGLVFPLADLIFSDSYKTLTENVRSAQHLGTGYVLDVKCHHLAFRQEGVDWQIWIEEGANPVPRKVVITYKESAGYPQYIALLSDWNLAADVPDSQFTAKLPAGAKQVDFGPADAKRADAKPKE
jgi:hypothetical protein